MCGYYQWKKIMWMLGERLCQGGDDWSYGNHGHMVSYDHIRFNNQVITAPLIINRFLYIRYLSLALKLIFIQPYNSNRFLSIISNLITLYVGLNAIVPAKYYINRFIIILYTSRKVTPPRIIIFVKYIRSGRVIQDRYIIDLILLRILI